VVEKNKITPDHLQFYNQILNGVSGFIIYHFAIKLTDVNLIETPYSDNEHEDSDENNNSKRPSNSCNQSPPKKKLKAT
jgi:hypothetical protein